MLATHAYCYHPPTVEWRLDARACR
jgi:hypothetical protein